MNTRLERRLAAHELRVGLHCQVRCPSTVAFHSGFQLGFSRQGNLCFVFVACLVLWKRVRTCIHCSFFAQMVTLETRMNSRWCKSNICAHPGVKMCRYPYSTRDSASRQDLLTPEHDLPFTTIVRYEAKLFSFPCVVRGHHCNF